MTGPMDAAPRAYATAVQDDETPDDVIDVVGDSPPPQALHPPARAKSSPSPSPGSAPSLALADGLALPPALTNHHETTTLLHTASEFNTKSQTETHLPSHIKPATTSRPSDRNKKSKRKAAPKSDHDDIEPVNPPPYVGPNLSGIEPKPKQFDPRVVASLSQQQPDTYWSHEAVHGDPDSMIAYIGTDCPLELVKNNSIRDRSPITSMTLSPDGTMLVTFSNSGSACFWDLDDFSLIQILRDADEEDIDEFYVGQFTRDSRLIVIGGKLKDRHRWSDQDDDNHILPCPIKVFDVVTGKVIEKFQGHDEEILCIKSAVFKEQNYFISTSQDGYIIKWRVTNAWDQLLERTWMQDGVTCMAFTVSFLPHTGNKYFVAACDDNIRLYDFEHSQLQQTFPSIYSYYCDCVKVVDCLDFPRSPAWSESLAQADNPDGPEVFAYIISRGVEMLDAENNTINSIPNTVRLHKLVYPRELGGAFRLEEVVTYSHELYRSNSWLIKITSNGRYVAAPTYDGNTCLFHMRTGELVGILQDHEGIEVRDVIFHPAMKLLLTSADDGTVKAYRQRTEEVQDACTEE